MGGSRELAKGHLDLLLLSGLEKRPLHGYGLIEAIREMSHATFDLPEGSVYPALHRLEREGFVTSSWSRGAGRARRIYKLSRSGRAELKKQRVEWSRFSSAINAVTGARA
jgi:PadR family transcriptional regulator, regulatory protein PadR